MACSPCFKPEKLAVKVTSPSFSTKVAVPFTLLPLLESKVMLTVLLFSLEAELLQPKITNPTTIIPKTIFFMMYFFSGIKVRISTTTSLKN
jgi:hypothetical protein